MTRHIGPSAQNDKTRLFLVRDIGNTGLSLIVSRQLDEVLAVWWRSVKIYLLIVILTAIVVTYLAIVATRRKRQVLADKAFSEQLIATANVIVVGLDAAGRITIFNETAERITGYRHDEVLGHSWFKLALQSNASSDVMKMIGKFRESGALPHTVEYSIVDKSGQEHIISWQNSVTKKPHSTISFGIDVTERKRMVDELVAARRRAENSNTAKSKFLAAISHDVCQPLHAQALFLDLLVRTELSAHQREVLDSAIAAAQSCKEMINTLLDFSRVEAGIMKASLQAFELQPLLNKIEREFGPQADAKGIVYRSRDTDLVLQSDPMMLELILRNLVSNAIRYTDHGGLLVTCRKRDSEALLEVWDTGIGISTAHQLALVPGLLPWQKNQIEIDPIDLPLDVEMGNVVQQVTPYPGGGSVVRFAVRRTRQALVVLHQPGGQPVPVGTRVRLLPNGPEFIAGRRGEVWLTDLAKARQAVQVSWPGGGCQLELEVPEADGLPGNIGPLACIKDSK